MRVELKTLRERVQRTDLQIDALARQLDGERSARAKLALGEAPAPTPSRPVPPPDFKLKKADNSYVPTVPYDLQRIRASQPEVPAALDPGWGTETTTTEPITVVSTRTDPALPAQKAPKK